MHATIAWLGAEVIKVERPGIGEQGRMASQDHPDTDSVYFVFLNSNKKSITLDLKSSRGRDIFDDLVQVSDVIIENFSSKTVRRLGLEYSTIRQVNQQIIYSSIKGFPKDGQFGEYLAFDPVAQAVGGSTAITGNLPIDLRSDPARRSRIQEQAYTWRSLFARLYTGVFRRARVDP